MAATIGLHSKKVEGAGAGGTLTVTGVGGTLTMIGAGGTGLGAEVEAGLGVGICQLVSQFGDV